MQYRVTDDLSAQVKERKSVSVIPGDNDTSRAQATASATSGAADASGFNVSFKKNEARKTRMISTVAATARMNTKKPFPARSQSTPPKYS